MPEPDAGTLPVPVQPLPSVTPREQNAAGAILSAFQMLLAGKTAMPVRFGRRVSAHALAYQKQMRFS